MEQETKPDWLVLWKQWVRRRPKLARFAQWLLDPAYVSCAQRDSLIRNLAPEARILNLGSGAKTFKREIINLDIQPYGHVDIVANGLALPFPEELFDLVLMEYVVEHVCDAEQLKREVFRVLKPGGLVYATVPFMQGYHGNPDDYYRFTASGFPFFWRSFEPVKSGVFGGPASALVCSVKEFLAILFSFNSRFLYSVLSQVFLLPLFPLKFLDFFLRWNKNAHHLAFSVFYIGRKP